MKIEILTENDGSHTIKGDNHYLCGQVTGLSAEQAVDLKRLLENAFSSGQSSGIRKAEAAIAGLR